MQVTSVSCAGHRMGELWTHPDVGTSTFEIVARVGSDIDGEAEVGEAQAAVAAALQCLRDEVVAGSPELRIVVRRLLDPLVHGPSPETLAGLGLTHVATFPGDVTSPQAWGGEERWELAAARPATPGHP